MKYLLPFLLLSTPAFAQDYGSYSPYDPGGYPPPGTYETYQFDGGWSMTYGPGGYYSQTIPMGDGASMTTTTVPPPSAMDGEGQ